MQIISFSILFLMCWSLLAQEANFLAPLSFKKWKDQQVVEAQNKVVRISNQLLLLKSEKYLPENTLPEVASANKDQQPIEPQEQEIVIKKNEKLLNTAIERFEVTKELTINEYFSVYLNQFRGQPEAIKLLAQKLNTEEIAEVLSTLLSLKNVELSAVPVVPKKISSGDGEEPVSSNL